MFSVDSRPKPYLPDWDRGKKGWGWKLLLPLSSLSPLLKMPRIAPEVSAHQKPHPWLRPRLGRPGECLSPAILTGGSRTAKEHGFPQQPEAVAQPDR